MIPKIAYFYWNNNTSLSYLRYLTLTTFRQLHPDWSMKLCYSDANINNKWHGLEEQDFLNKNNGIDYIKEVSTLNIEIISYLKHTDKAPNFISDFFRWDILSQTGGWYFDLDQIILKNFNPLCEYDFVIDGSDSCFVGVVGCAKECEAAKYIHSRIQEAYNPNFYNSAGPWFIRQLINTPKDHKLMNILQHHKTLFAKRDLFYPIHPDNIDHIFKNNIQLPKESYCLHWFGGHPTSQEYNKIINKDSKMVNTLFTYLKPLPKITFGIIVVNGEPWIEILLKSLYKHAHSICIAEGATVNWKETNDFKTPRSTDNTINIIKNFPDPDNKIRLTTPDIFYTEKLEQCNAWLNIAPKDTDYIWQVDTDEFYHDYDIEYMKRLLSMKEYTYVEFPTLNFFKGVDYIAIGGQGWGYDTPFPRIFKYHKNCKWLTHRPPTILNENGRDLRSINPLLGKDNPIQMYHYSYVTDKQVLEKIQYYTKTFNRDYMNQWYIPYYKEWNIENRLDMDVLYSAHPSCPFATTKRFTKEHPQVIQDHYPIKNTRCIIRIDDFPTGIRPILADITPLIEILKKFTRHFSNIKLGVVPKLLTIQLYNMIQDMNVELCMHGYDHNYWKYSPNLKNDPYNIHTYTTGFNEFENCSYTQILANLKEGKDIIEQLSQKQVTTYIPPCNIIDQQTKTALKAIDIKTVMVENTIIDDNFEYIKSDFYGRVLDLDSTKKYKVATFHLTWEYDELTWKKKDSNKWQTTLERLKLNENLV